MLTNIARITREIREKAGSTVSTHGEYSTDGSQKKKKKSEEEERKKEIKPVTMSREDGSREH